MANNSQSDPKASVGTAAELESCDCVRIDRCTCPDGIVCVRNVSFAYGSELALEKITFCVPRTCMVGVIGPNGGGKTTLLKLILGLLEPTSGQLDVLGRRATRLARLRSQIGYVPQRLGIDLNFPASVKDVIISGCYGQLAMFQRLPAKRKARVSELMDLTGVSVYADQPIGDLSVGQQQRVFITRALVADPQLLIVDEPTSGVDIAGQARFFELIGSLRKEFALTVIMVSHNIDQLAKHADYLVCLNRTLHWHDTKRPLDLHMIEEVYGCELRAHIDHYHTEGHHH